MYVILEKQQKSKKSKIVYVPVDVVPTYHEAKNYIASDPLNYAIDFTSKAIKEHYYET